MCERRVDNAGIRNACDKFLRAYSWQQAQLSFEPVVGPAFRFKKIAENIWIGRESGKNALFVWAVFRWDEPARVSEVDCRKKREGIRPPATLVH